MKRSGSRAKGVRRAPRRPPVRLGVIGGSGLYQMPGIEDAREVRMRTPFGAPSDALMVGTVDGVGVAFLPRHGRGHRLLPSEINYCANVYALKSLGCEFLLSVSAVGSLRAEIRPGDVVVPDQFIDKTTKRRTTFFGDGLVGHVTFGDPVCATLSKLVVEAARAERGEASGIHPRGTYVCMEGPQFSTRAESELHRQWRADVIGMTNASEAKLAREAELCFGTLALATDYDCWNASAGDVEIGEILRILKEGTDRAQRIVRRVVGRLPAARECPCASALATALITDRASIPRARVRELGPIVGKYLGG